MMENSFLDALLPIHPKLVHFPIALSVSALGIQVLGMVLKKDSLCQSAWTMFILAVLSVPVAGLSGFWEVNRLQLEHSVLEEHKQFAFAAFYLSLAGLPLLWFMRKKNSHFFQKVFLLFLFIFSGLLVWAAHHGGRMVYDCSIGVNQ